MKTVVSIISHVKRGDSFLFRKKPAGSLPYKETWYGFGAVLDGDNQDPDTAIKDSVKARTGITIEITEYLWWDTETKIDLDGEEKFFIYLHSVSEFIDGELTLSEGIEKLEWIPISSLNEYDIIPPSKKFLDRYLNQ